MPRLYRSFCRKVGRGITKADKSSFQSKMRYKKTKGMAVSLEQRVSRGFFWGKEYCIF